VRHRVVADSLRGFFYKDVAEIVADSAKPRTFVGFLLAGKTPPKGGFSFLANPAPRAGMIKSGNASALFCKISVEGKI
jgi:hypothetical protein